MKVTKTTNGVGKSEMRYTLTEDELIRLINVGMRFGRWFDWTMTRHCDKDGFPILRAYEEYEPDAGDEPCLEFLLMKAGLYEDGKIPERAMDAQVDYNHRHEAVTEVDYAEIYRRYDKENDPGYYGKENILDNVKPFRYIYDSTRGQELSDEELDALKTELRKEKED